MVQSTPPLQTPLVNNDEAFDVENLPALIKQLNDATGVADGVESKLDLLMAQIEALEKNLEHQFGNVGVRNETDQPPEAINSSEQSEQKP